MSGSHCQVCAPEIEERLGGSRLITGGDQVTETSNVTCEGWFKCMVKQVLNGEWLGEVRAASLP